MTNKSTSKAARRAEAALADAAIPLVHGRVTYDRERHRVAVVGIPGVKLHLDGDAGLHHVAFTYGSRADLIDL